MRRYPISARFVTGILLFLVIAAAGACSSKQERARKVIQEHLQNQGIRDLKVDLFHTAEKSSAQAYIAVTVTYNFASSDGAFQKEYQGYVLKQDGTGWSIDHNAPYTKDTAHAETIIAGGK